MGLPWILDISPLLTNRSRDVVIPTRVNSLREILKIL